VLEGSVLGSAVGSKDGVLVGSVGTLEGSILGSMLGSTEG
jgi:hypothetical protein